MNDVIWSINIMIAILLIAVGIFIYWIFKYDDYNETTVKEELLQLPSGQDQQSS
jgi:heme/copper-type cytochrome/quinol oxidase subunit 2